MRTVAGGILFTLIAAGAVSLLAQQAGAQSCSISRVTEGRPSLNQLPDLNDAGDMVWQQAILGIWEIFHYDAASGETTNFSNTPEVHEWSPRLNSRGDIAWVHDGGISDHHVMLYEAATGTTRQLTAPAACRNLGFIDLNDNGDVVWPDDACDQASQVWLYEAATGTSRQISNHSPANVLPRINDHGDIVWMNYDPVDRTTWEVMLYDGFTGSISQLTDNALEDIPTGINNARQVIWERDDNAPTDVYLHEIATGTAVNLSDSPNSQSNSVLNDLGQVAWAGQDGADRELEIYDPVSGTVTRVTDDDGVALPGAMNNLGEVALQGSTANDGSDASRRQIWLYSPLLPVADAGEDLAIPVHMPAILDGSGSCDPNGDPLSYHWEVLSRPPGSQAMLDDPTAQLPGIVVDAPGGFVFRLRVGDGAGLSVPRTVTVTGINMHPVADAGPDQVIEQVGTPITLDGSSSFDGDGDALTYEWTLQSPSLSEAELSDPNALNPSFVADEGGFYTARLVVTDVFGASSAPDFVQISFDNVPPVADAGENLAGYVGHTVTLDGSGSSDANGERVLYRWTLESVPEGSAAWLDGDRTATPSFFADLPGEYVVTLVARDHQSESEPDTVTVVAVAGEDAAVENLIALIALINESVPRSDFKAPGLKKWMTHKLGKALMRVEAGELAAAMILLEARVLPRTDGCAIQGRPDRNDWVRGGLIRNPHHRHGDRNERRFGRGRGLSRFAAWFGWLRHRHRGPVWAEPCASQELIYPELVKIIELLDLALNPDEPPPPPPPPPGGGGL